MIDLLLKNILTFHEQLDAGKGIRDIGLIESAVKAARLFYGLVKNHGFVDGNKRVAAHALIVFLRINSFDLRASDDEFFQVTMETAAGIFSAEQIKIWLLDNAQAMPSVFKDCTITITSSEIDNEKFN